ncbi:MAG: hypothetical protein KDD74_15365 [Anaerolineales bacterium]|nr:hypothetical protein [Anaerolineales bacterium]
MNYRHFKYEGWLYAFAFAIALAVRFIGLGAMPLTDAEAAPALQALHLSQSANPTLDPHPLYILTTSILFLAFGGGTNFLARFIPALIGSLLVLAPLLFEDRLKPRPSLILAFFLALDPGLVAISRQAASPILAITFLVFTVGFFNKAKPSHTAVCAALALLSGPSIWFGILSLGITLAIAQLFKQRTATETKQLETNHEAQETDSETQSTQTSSPPAPVLNEAKEFHFPFPTFLFTFILAGSLFFTIPSGIGAAFASIPAFIEKWTTGSTITQGMALISLPVYQPFALLLAGIALIRGWAFGYRRVILLSVWLFVSFLLVIFMPARQMADLAWMLLPLHAIAALELTRHITIYPEERREILGVILLTSFLWAFAWLGLSSLNWLPIGTSEYTLRAAMLFGSLLLLIVSLILIAAGWSIRTASLGGIWGMALGLGVLTVGSLFGAAGLRGTSFPELWWQPAIPTQAQLLRETISQVSETSMGNDYAATVAIMGIESPALEWTLRENHVEIVHSLDVTSTPDFVITPYELNPELISAYRGQDFLWRQNPSWQLATPADWFRWVTLREMLTTQENIILWARSDLFLGSE